MTILSRIKREAPVFCLLFPGADSGFLSRGRGPGLKKSAIDLGPHFQFPFFKTDYPHIGPFLLKKKMHDFLPHSVDNDNLRPGQFQITTGNPKTFLVKCKMVPRHVCNSGLTLCCQWEVDLLYVLHGSKKHVAALMTNIPWLFK